MTEDVDTTQHVLSWVGIRESSRREKEGVSHAIEAFQAVVWHCLVSHPALQRRH
jgi:hypothetical protein